MVTTIARAWSRPGDHRVLEQRHADTVDELQRLGGQGIYPVSEAAVDSMRAEIRRLTPPPVQPDPAVRDAAREFHEAVRRHQRLHFDLEERRKKLHSLRDTPAHRLLGDVPAELFARPLDTQQMVDAVFGDQPTANPIPGEIRTPQGWTSAREFREGALKVQAEIGKLSDLAARVEEPLRYESYATPDKCMCLIFALASRVGALEDRINHLEQPARATRSKRR